MSYTEYSVLLLGLAAVPALVMLARRPPSARWWAATAVTCLVLLVLTVVFDSLMVSVDLFRYDVTRSLGVDVWLTPVEDLAWPVAAALLAPALWRLSR